MIVLLQEHAKDGFVEAVAGRDGGADGAALDERRRAARVLPPAARVAAGREPAHRRAHRLGAQQDA